MRKFSFLIKIKPVARFIRFKVFGDKSRVDVPIVFLKYDGNKLDSKLSKAGTADYGG